MHTKRGQLAVFIMVGIVVLIVIGAILYIRGSVIGGTAEKRVSSIEASSLSAFASRCVSQTGENAVVYTGLRGGIAFPQVSVPFSGISIPYYYYEGDDITPTEDVVKATLNFYMENALKDCTAGFKSFVDQGYLVQEGNVTSTVTIAEEDVIFDVEYPLTIVKGEARESRSSFNAKVNVELPKMMAAAQEYIASQSQNPNAFRHKHLIDIGIEKDIKFEVFDRGEGRVIISLIDEKNKINENPFIFAFAVKYNWTASAQEGVPDIATS